MEPYMDLDLNIGLELEPELTRVRGRAKRQVCAAVVRELTQADLAQLETERGTKPQALTRLRERHHGLARALAAGMSNQQAAAITGYDASRISILLGDPAFQELLTFYRENVNAEFVKAHELMAGANIDALIKLREQLEDEDLEWTPGQVLEAVKVTSDRSGLGPSSSSTQVNVHVNMAERLEAARHRVEAARTIEHEAVPGVSRSGEGESPPLRGSGDTNTPARVSGSGPIDSVSGSGPTEAQTSETRIPVGEPFKLEDES